jgi:hypothetical protein
MKKALLFLFLMFLFSGFSEAQNKIISNTSKLSALSYKFMMNGDAVSGVWNGNFPVSVKSLLKNQNKTQSEPPQYNTTFVYTGCSTIYDFVSGGTPQNIVQDPNNLNYMHLVCMYAPPGDGTSFPNRKTKYYFSTNKGTSWSFIANVPNVRSGFPVITLASDGTELISVHTTNGGTVQTTQWYKDVYPGLGSFTQIMGPVSSTQYTWPRTVTTSSLSLANKFVTVAGINNPSYDSCSWITGYPAFSSWHYLNSGKPEAYSIARSANGKIGVAYKISDDFSAQQGSVYFMESTDNGTSFGTPLKIYNSVIGSSGDSLGMLRGIELVYQENSPKVVFEIVKQAASSSGIYFPNDGKNHIRFWSNSLPGSDPNRSIKIADTTLVGFHPYINTNSPVDIFTILCRPTIGVSSDGSGLFVAFMVPSGLIGGSVDFISYMDIWLMYSTNNGANWVAPVKVNPASPVRDWIHPCISIVNDNTTSYYYVNMSMLSDSIPGSYVNNQENGESQAKVMFARTEIPVNTGGNPPPAPVLISPSNGNACVSVTPLFDWQDVTNAASYRIQVSASPSFTNNVIDVSGLTSSQYTAGSGVLTYNMQYYWRVNATNSNGTGNWSNTLNFITTPPAPAGPQLTYPLNGATNMPPVFTFSWYLSHNATTYRLQVSQSTSFTNNLLDSVTTSTQLTVPAGILNYTSVYYWRLCAINCGGAGTWSAVWGFLTGPLSVQTYSNEIPTEYKLHNNFPNPFNPVTKIRFDLPKASAVKLIIYDVTGKVIDELINKNLSAGKFEAEWNAKNYSSGIYFYKLETENFTDVKKLVLLK